MLNKLVQYKVLPALYFALLISVFFTSASSVFSVDGKIHEERIEVKVTRILEENSRPIDGKDHLYQKLECIVTKGSIAGQVIFIESGKISTVSNQKYSVGDELVVMSTKDGQGNDLFYITDFVRRKPIFWLFMIFIALSVFIAGVKGVSSFISMAVSFVVIMKVILPLILSGVDPVLTAIASSLLIIPVTFYLSHGLNRKTTAAVLGTFFSLVIVGILTAIFAGAAKLTGFASEEAAFLQVVREGVNIKGILTAGIIIGVMGVLDDVTISQSSIVQELLSSGKKFSIDQLYIKAMRVGKDHISSMINTLVLVYTGASLPLLLLFIDKSNSFFDVISYEIVAEEIVRTLVGSIGLILAVPVTTLIAVFLISVSGENKSLKNIDD